MLIIEIALGIILAIVVLSYLPEILAFSFLATLAVVSLWIVVAIVALAWGDRPLPSWREIASPIGGTLLVGIACMVIYTYTKAAMDGYKVAGWRGAFAAMGKLSEEGAEKGGAK